MSQYSATFPVGLQLSHEDLPSVTPTANSDASPTFIRAIMHRVVNPRPFLAHVQYDAPAAAIAAACAVPEHRVENLWLAAVRTPPLQNSSLSPSRPAILSHKDDHVRPRFTPQSLLDAADITNPMSNSACMSKKETTLHQLSKPSSFDHLFTRQRAVNSDCAEFGNALIGRLEVIAGCAPFPRCCVAEKKRVRREGGVGKCGFCITYSHVDLDVFANGMALCKMGGGLYRTALTSGSIFVPKKGVRNVYFEVAIVDDVGSGGICIGIGAPNMALNKLVGSDAQSCGLHSSGQIVCNMGDFRDFGNSFQNGDRIGCLVDVSANVEQQGVGLTYWINGVRQGRVVQKLKCEERRFMPMVSLYKKSSKVVLLCCEKDWQLGKDNIAFETQVSCVCSNE